MKNSAVTQVQLLLLGLLLMLAPLVSFCQQTTVDKYLNALPKNLLLDNSNTQTYNVTLHWNNRDIDGTLINDNIVTARFTRGFEDGSVIWNDVKLSNIKDGNANEVQLIKLNGLRYNTRGNNITKQEFYNSFPQEHVDLIRWFVQDAVAIEIYGWMYFDSLKLNQVFHPNFFKNQRIEFENYVNFTSQGLSLCWTGISKMDNKVCAIIRYQSLYNPIDANTEAMKLHGRSTYWGDIWVSLTDKHIEYATMNEDVIFKMILTANKFEQRIDLQRDIIFEKVK